MLQEELERLQRQQITVLQGVDETSERCNSFIQVPKVNGKVRLCLDLARLNNTLIRPVYTGPALNALLPRLAGVNTLH